MKKKLQLVCLCWWWLRLEWIWRICWVIVIQSKMAIWKYSTLIRSIEFVIVRYVCKGASTFHCTVLRLNAFHRVNYMFALKTKFVTNGRSFSWSFIISGTLKEWSSFYLLTAHFVFARITWGTFSFSFYSHFLIYFVINDCLSVYKISWVFLFF